MFLRLIFIALLLAGCYKTATCELKTFSVTVKLVLGERETREELRELATLQAKRQALEQAGTYLQQNFLQKKTEQDERFKEFTRQDIIALTAGVVTTKIVAEQ